MSADWYERLTRHPRLLPPAKRDASGGTQIMAVLEQYRLTECLPPNDLAAQQRTLLLSLAEYAVAQSPHFARRLAAARLTPAELPNPAGCRVFPRSPGANSSKPRRRFSAAMSLPLMGR